MKVFKKIIHFFTKYFKKYSVYEADSPVVIQYANVTDVVQEGTLFGDNEFGFNEKDPTFGNPNLQVTNCLDGNYERVLRQSASKPFSICNFRIHYNCQHKDFYLTNKIVYTAKDANGVVATTSFLPLTDFDIYQQQNDIVDMKSISRINEIRGRKFYRGVDGNTHFKFKVKEKTTLVISVYPYKEVVVGYSEYKAHLKKQEQGTMKITMEFDLKKFFKQLFFIK